MLSRAALFAACTLALPALACRSDAAGTGAGGDESPPSDSAAPAVTDDVRDSLGLRLGFPASLRVGEPVTVSLHVQNRTRRALDLYLRGRAITFDVVIARASGEVVWQRLEDEIIPAIVHLRPMAPEERFELQVAWDPRTRDGQLLEPGEYTARGLLLTEGEPLETPTVEFRIEP